MVRKFRLYLHLPLLLLVLFTTSCAAKYDKATGGYTGALACVDVSILNVFTWKCVEQSTVPDVK